MSNSSICPIVGPYRALPHRDRVDLGAMAMKSNFASSKVPALLDPHHVICWTLIWSVLPLFRDAVDVFHCPSRLGRQNLYLLPEMLQILNKDDLN